MPYIQRRINVDATSIRCIDINATLNKRHHDKKILKRLTTENNKKTHTEMKIAEVFKFSELD